LESYNPKMQAFWFGLFPFRSPLLRESSFLFLPAGNEMFQFPASTSAKLCIDLSVTSYNRCWVSPFGNLWIKAYLQLPKAYRCSSRPSSAPSAKASTMRPCSLNLDLTVGFKKLLLAIEVFLSLKILRSNVLKTHFTRCSRFILILFFSIQFSMSKKMTIFSSMEPSGIEPLTSCVQSRRSPS